LSIYKETDIINLYFSNIQETNSCSNCRNSASYNSSPSPEITWACSLWHTS